MADTPPMQVSVVFQMEPLQGIDGNPFSGNLDTYAQSLAGYLAQQIERFADPRGGDVFLQLVVKRGGEMASHEYRSGHYVKSDAGDAPEPDPDEREPERPVTDLELP